MLCWQFMFMPMFHSIYHWDFHNDLLLAFWNYSKKLWKIKKKQQNISKESLMKTQCNLWDVVFPTVVDLFKCYYLFLLKQQWSLSSGYLRIHLHRQISAVELWWLWVNWPFKKPLPCSYPSKIKKSIQTSATLNTTHTATWMEQVWHVCLCVCMVFGKKFTSVFTLQFTHRIVTQASRHIECPEMTFPIWRFSSWKKQALLITKYIIYYFSFRYWLLYYVFLYYDESTKLTAGHCQIKILLRQGTNHTNWLKLTREEEKYKIYNMYYT